MAGTTGLNSVERIHGVYSEKMVGNNVCEWIGYDRSGKEITRKSEKFIVKKKNIIKKIDIDPVCPLYSLPPPKVGCDYKFEKNAN